MKKSILAASLLAITLAAPLVQAHKAGDIIIRAGAITVDPHEKSGHVYVDRGTMAYGDLGGKATLDSDTQLGLNFAYMITDHIGVELLAATPFTHNVHVKNTILSPANGKLGQVTHLPPTLSLVYYPLDTSWAFQPYVGLGINYTWFYHSSLSNEAKYGSNGAKYSNFKVKNSWGWAAQIGADYMITDNIMLNAQIRYIDIDTQATVNVNAFNDLAGQQRARVNLDVNPWVYMVGIGYKFNL